MLKNIVVILINIFSTETSFGNITDDYAVNLIKKLINSSKIPVVKDFEMRWIKLNLGDEPCLV